MKKSLILLVSILLLAVTGCMDYEQEVFLNTDGSGKAILSYKILPAMAAQYSMYSHDNDTDPAKQMLQTIIEDENLLACDKLEYSKTDDGGYLVKSVLYFENLEDLDAVGSGESPYHLVFEKTDEGKLVLKNKTYDHGMDEEDLDVKKTLTDEEIEFKFKQLQAQLKQSKAMYTQYLEGFRYKTIFHLPGVIEEASVFETVDSNTVAFELNGKKMNENFEALIADEARLKQMIKDGENNGMAGMQSVWLGSHKPMLTIVESNVAMNVDYSQEIEAAKANMKEMVNKLGLEYIEPVEVIIDANNIPEIKSAAVLGVKIINKSQKKENDSRRNYSSEKQGYKVFACVDLTTAVSEIQNIEIYSAVDNKGNDLLKEDNYTYASYTSTDKTRYGFDVDMKLPGKDSNSIAEISGEITCVAMGKCETKNVGVVELRDDWKSESGDIEITYLYRNEYYDPNGDEEAGSVHLKIKNSGEKIMEVKLVDENGQEFKAYEPCGGGINQRGKSVEVALEFSEPMPEVAQVQLVTTKHFKEFDLPFKIENFDLLGRSLN